MGNVVQAGRRAGAGPAGGDLRGGIPDTVAGPHDEQGVRLRAEGGHARGPGIKAGDAELDRRRRHGEHEPGAVPAARRPARLQVRRPEDGRCARSTTGCGARSRTARWATRPSTSPAKCGVSRADQDRFSAQSHQRAAAAWASGGFADEIVPVDVPGERRTKPLPPVSEMRAFAPTRRPRALAKLRPAFRPDGTVTAGNASQLSDGAAALVVASRAVVEQSRGEAAGAHRGLRHERRSPEGHLHRPGAGGEDRCARRRS